MDCKMKDNCEQIENGGECDFRCYAHTVLYGTDGESGLWAKRNIPKLYKEAVLSVLPTIEPAKTNMMMHKYVTKIEELTQKGMGLYLFSTPTPNNPLGTGNGKTTVATTILNEYLLYRVEQHVNGNPMKSNPVFFMEMADFQNVYNGQFRGTRDNQDHSSDVFYGYKKRMKTVDLLVIDDIAIRNSTEAFMNELYEIVNHRVNEGLTTIYTSNIPLNGLVDIFGERIVSRIEGSTFQYPFTGKDFRRKGWD